MAAAYSLAGNVSLRALNTFGVDATAAWLATIHDPHVLPDVLALPQAAAGTMVLGEGSNVLFAADYPGTMLRLAFDAVHLVEDDCDSALVRSEAGCRWDPMVD